VLRRGLVPRLGDALGSDLGADAVVMVVGVPVVAVLVAWLGWRAGVGRADWECRVTLRTVGAGLDGIGAYFVVYLAIAMVLVAVLDADPGLGATGGSGSAVPAWAVALFVLGNGVLVPIAEELARRGVIQTGLRAA